MKKLLMEALFVSCMGHVSLIAAAAAPASFSFEVTHEGFTPIKVIARTDKRSCPFVDALEADCELSVCLTTNSMTFEQFKTIWGAVAAAQKSRIAHLDLHAFNYEQQLAARVIALLATSFIQIGSLNLSECFLPSGEPKQIGLPHSSDLLELICGFTVNSINGRVATSVERK